MVEVRNQKIDTTGLVYLAERFPSIKIGKETYSDGIPTMAGEHRLLEIGSFTSISRDVKLLMKADHRPDWVTMYPFSPLWRKAAHIQGHPATKGPIIIGSDVVLSIESTVLSGVTIGDGALIGAGAVVTRSIPPYAIAAGNPARVVKMRFEDGVIARLMYIRWWDWPNDRIEKAIPYLLSDDIGTFIKKVEAFEL